MEISEWHEKNRYERYKPLKHGEYEPRRAAKEYPEEVPQFSNHHVRPPMFTIPVITAWSSRRSNAENPGMRDSELPNRPLTIGEWDENMDNLAHRNESGMRDDTLRTGDLFLNTENMTMHVVSDDGSMVAVSTMEE